MIIIKQNQNNFNVIRYRIAYWLGVIIVEITCVTGLLTSLLIASHSSKPEPWLAFGLLLMATIAMNFLIWKFDKDNKKQIMKLDIDSNAKMFTFTNFENTTTQSTYENLNITTQAFIKQTIGKTYRTCYEVSLSFNYLENKQKKSLLIFDKLKYQEVIKFIRQFFIFAKDKEISFDKIGQSLAETKLRNIYQSMISYIVIAWFIIMSIINGIPSIITRYLSFLSNFAQKFGIVIHNYEQAQQFILSLSVIILIVIIVIYYISVLINKLFTNKPSISQFFQQISNNKD